MRPLKEHGGSDATGNNPGDTRAIKAKRIKRRQADSKRERTCQHGFEVGGQVAAVQRNQEYRYSGYGVKCIQGAPACDEDARQRYRNTDDSKYQHALP